VKGEVESRKDFFLSHVRGAVEAIGNIDLFSLPIFLHMYNIPFTIFSPGRTSFVVHVPYMERGAPIDTRPERNPN